MLFCSREFPDTAFTSVRFGNVSESRGSVIPLFRRQISRGGPVTVTHPEVTRYFISISEAAHLVMQTAAINKKSNLDIYMLEMGDPEKILNIARRMIMESEKTDVEIKFTGLRPGEKLFEEFLVEKEKCFPTAIERIYAARQPQLDTADFEIALSNLLQKAGALDLAEIRCMLTRIGTGLRDPDTGGAQQDDK